MLFVDGLLTNEFLSVLLCLLPPCVTLYIPILMEIISTLVLCTALSLGRGGSHVDNLNAVCKEQEAIYIHSEAHKVLTAPFQFNTGVVDIVGCSPSIQCVSADAALIVVKQDLKMQFTGVGSVLATIG